MSRPIIDFVCSWRGFHIRNRGSAVGSMACCALDMLAERFEIRANGAPFAEPSPAAGLQGHVRAMTLKRLLPRTLKQLAREWRDERTRASLMRRLFGLHPRPCAVFELYKFGSDVGLRLSRRHEVPLVLYFDAPEVIQAADIEGTPPVAGRRAAIRERESVRNASVVIAYSEPVRRFLLETHGCDPARVRVFQTLDHSRMSPEPPPPPRHPPTIGYVGSFMPWHRLPMLIDAFESLRLQGLQARLLLIGSGMARESIERRIAASRFKEEIEMPGFLDRGALAAQKSRIDIAVLPGTMWYNLPTKVFEYGAAGRATVAPRSPTVESLFRDQHEIALFRDADAADLAETLKRLLVSPDRRHELGAALAGRIHERHSYERMRSFYLGLFAEVADSALIPSARK